MVYPRVCGGTRSQRRARLPDQGLSPRVRGNPAGLAQRHHSPRSIPACAGEPDFASDCGEQRQVYPRVCGGTGDVVIDPAAAAGLSPRVRGNHPLYLRPNPIVRSIPACAGEPMPSRQTTPLPSVYPRVCGGTRQPHHPRLPVPGLSPRVRGNPAYNSSGMSGQRSIPACAGEPRWANFRRPRAGVYPRVCGGTGGPGPLTRGRKGLSPRVRGNRGAYSYAQFFRGSIPACAGEPLGRIAGAGRGRVYPRVCGGTPWGRNAAAIANGLSPRVRGNRRRRIAQSATRRSIPACAGEPFRCRPRP